VFGKGVNCFGFKGHLLFAECVCFVHAISWIYLIIKVMESTNCVPGILTCFILYSDSQSYS
jgi:hypothetical protein